MDETVFLVDKINDNRFYPYENNFLLQNKFNFYQFLRK